MRRLKRRSHSTRRAVSERASRGRGQSGGEVVARRDRQLAECVAKVELDGLHRHEQLLCDLSVAAAGGRQFRDPTLARGQRLGTRERRPGGASLRPRPARPGPGPPSRARRPARRCRGSAASGSRGGGAVAPAAQRGAQLDQRDRQLVGRRRRRPAAQRGLEPGDQVVGRRRAARPRANARATARCEPNRRARSSSSATSVAPALRRPPGPARAAADDRHGMTDGLAARIRVWRWPHSSSDLDRPAGAVLGQQHLAPGVQPERERGATGPGLGAARAARAAASAPSRSPRSRRASARLPAAPGTARRQPWLNPSRPASASAAASAMRHCARRTGAR